jgi:hypothetical protein
MVDTGPWAGWAHAGPWSTMVRACPECAALGAVLLLAAAAAPALAGCCRASYSAIVGSAWFNMLFTRCSEQ